MEQLDHEKLALRHLQDWLDDLQARAEKVVEAHWALIKDGERKVAGWENKSCLQLRLVRQGNSIRLEWVKITWRGSKAKGTRVAIRQYVRKGSGYGYNLKTLEGLCKEWEKPLVADTEAKLAAIRREWVHVNKAIQMIRFAKDARKAAMAADKSAGSAA